MRIVFGTRRYRPREAVYVYTDAQTVKEELILSAVCTVAAVVVVAAIGWLSNR